jgi:hypothetical protein
MLFRLTPSLTVRTLIILQCLKFHAFRLRTVGILFYRAASAIKQEIQHPSSYIKLGVLIFRLHRPTCGKLYSLHICTCFLFFQSGNFLYCTLGHVTIQ